MNSDYVPLPEHFYPATLHDSPCTYWTEIESISRSFYANWDDNGEDLNKNSIGNEDESDSMNGVREDEMVDRLYLDDGAESMDEKQESSMTLTFAS